MTTFNLLNALSLLDTDKLSSGLCVKNQALQTAQSEDDLHKAIEHAQAFSHYLKRLLHKEVTLEQELKEGLDLAFDLTRMQNFYPWDTLESSDELMLQLRRLRQRVMAHIIIRDINRYADLNEVITTVSVFAQFALTWALHIAKKQLSQFGEARNDQGEIQELIIIGMGKLGGFELNVSSDIDLIFVYPDAGETDGSRSLSNQEYFTRLGKEIIRIINETTEHGFVFRVDMRLRPYGDSGPLVMSFTALENYLLTQGREWERYAWIKARALSGDAHALNNMIRPFVYRRYLDYNAYGAMRDLHAQIQREVARKDMHQNIKLGPGGIREAEFIAQVFQLIRGGRNKPLQEKSTRACYRILQEQGLLSEETIAEILAAYTFLRHVEHRLQYWDDLQTQTLPTLSEQQLLLAQSMGFTLWEDFLSCLNTHRRHVTRHFEQVFFLPTENAPVHPLTSIWQDILEVDASAAIRALDYQDSAQIIAQLKTLKQSARYEHMSLNTRKTLDALIGPLLELCAHMSNPDLTFTRILTFLESISKRASYLALLNEHPQTLQRLASLCSSSAWVANYLNSHAILLDELLDARILYASPNWDEFNLQLAEQLNSLENDTEAKMDCLRHFHHAQTFRLVAQDLSGMWTLEALSDELSRLADCILKHTLEHVWRSFTKRPIDTPKFAIIGYGKLGGKELGYSSDLDLIFLYEDEHPDASEFYAKLARRLSTWLTSTTFAGVLYDIDLRLRPNGQSGLLVSSLESFERYQLQNAWVWEHQALTRARFITGDAQVGQKFEAIRLSILQMKRDKNALIQEICLMRERIKESFADHAHNLKYAQGGIVDVEFIVQFLILAYAEKFPSLCDNTGTIALLEEAARFGLIDANASILAQNAYRVYRRLQHAARLKEESRVDVDEALLTHYQHVKQLWDHTFLQ